MYGKLLLINQVAVKRDLAWVLRNNNRARSCHVLEALNDQACFDQQTSYWPNDQSTRGLAADSFDCVLKIKTAYGLVQLLINFLDQFRPAKLFGHYRFLTTSLDAIRPLLLYVGATCTTFQEMPS